MMSTNHNSFVISLVVLLFILSACTIIDEANSGVLNEWIQVGNWDVKLSQIEITDFFELNDREDRIFVPRDGRQFMFFHLLLQNNDTQSREFAPHPPTFTSRTKALNIDMDIGEPRRFLPTDLTLYVNGIFQERFDILRATAAPDEQISGIVVFEIPMNAVDDLDKNLILYFSNDGEKISFDVRVLMDK